MILIIGANSNPTVTYYLKYLDDNKINYLYLNQLNLAQDACFFEEHFLYQGKNYYYNQFSGVLSKFAQVISSNINTNNANSFLHSILHYKFAKVVNRPSFSLSNELKLFQIDNVVPKSIEIPYSVVLSNFHCKDNQYLKQMNTGKYVVKSLSGERSIVKKLDNDNSHFGSSAREPVLFQSFIEGYNVRVHVVKDECFSIKIDSNTVDYRYDNTAQGFHIYQLPKIIQEDCINIARQTKLSFTGIDLICSKGKYFLLELNPSPGWSYFEQRIKGQYISKMLTNFLTAKNQ